MSSELFDALADRYDAHFEEPHRAAYDQLAWEAVTGPLANAPQTVIDAGCGIGRWAGRLLAEGHRVIGIEQSPRMAAVARRRYGNEPRFTLVEGNLASVEHPVLLHPEADAVLAIGSVQYTPDPEAAIARLATWARSGGTVSVLVDSLVALVLELWAAGRPDEAELRARTGRGVWTEGERSAELRLFDRSSLIAAFAAAGLDDIEVSGLLVGASAFGRAELTRRLHDDMGRALAVERRFSASEVMADAGKHLLAIGRR